jgi:hypothetical protein
MHEERILGGGFSPPPSRTPLSLDAMRASRGRRLALDGSDLHRSRCIKHVMMRRRETTMRRRRTGKDLTCAGSVNLRRWRARLARRSPADSTASCTLAFSTADAAPVLLDPAHPASIVAKRRARKLGEQSRGWSEPALPERIGSGCGGGPVGRRRHCGFRPRRLVDRSTGDSDAATATATFSGATPVGRQRQGRERHSLAQHPRRCCDLVHAHPTRHADWRGRKCLHRRLDDP